MNLIAPLGFTKNGTPRLRRPKSFRRTPYQRRLWLNNVRRRRISWENRTRGLRFDGKPRILANHNPKLGRLSKQERSNWFTRRWRKELLADGLTVNGTERVYRVWPDLKKLTGRARARVRERIWRFNHRRALIDAGYTTRGRDRIPAQERAWRALRATMNIRVIDPVELLGGQPSQRDREHGNRGVNRQKRRTANRLFNPYSQR